MRRLRDPAVLLLAGSLLVSCGIGPGPVRSEGQPKSGGIEATETSLDLRRPSQISDAVLLVERFLEAPSVDAIDRANTLASYILPKERESWRPGVETNVVRVVGKPTSRGTGDGTTTPVEVTVQHIGGLVDGAVVPSTRGTETIMFTAINVPGEGLYLRAPTTEVLLSDHALGTYFDARSLYSWSDTDLVPDLRYVPGRLAPERKADLLVKWLYDGPKLAWLRIAVQTPDPDTKPDKRVAQDDGFLTVDLAKPASTEEYGKLATQMAKTLVVSPIRGLKLTTQGQEIQQPHVPKAESDRGVPRRYAVVNGSVVRLRVGDSQTDPVVGLGDYNKNVVLAGFSWGETAAFVAQQEAAGLRLLIGLRPALAPVSLPGQTKPPKQVGQPVWLEPSAALVPVDGRLYHVTLDGKATQVQGVEGVTSMSVAAADRTRIAMVVNGSLVIGALKRAGTGAVSVQQLQTVPTMLTRVDSVVFGRTALQQLMVAGADATNVRLVQMRIDGTEQILYSQADNWQNSLQITHLVAEQQNGTALFEIKALNASFEAQVAKSESLQDRILLSPSATPDQRAAAKPSAPSFEG